MPLFKKINYGKVLYEALRNYFSVNTSGDMSIMYRYCAALIFPLQAAFDAYDAKRRVYEIVARCKWVIGQLTNVLNYLYDPVLQRIFLTQATILNLSAPEFPYTSLVQIQEFDVAAQAQGREFRDRSAGTDVIINVPIGTDIAAITATIEQIKIDGIPYSIIEF